MTKTRNLLSIITLAALTLTSVGCGQQSEYIASDPPQGSYAKTSDGYSSEDRNNNDTFPGSQVVTKIVVGQVTQAIKGKIRAATGKDIPVGAIIWVIQHQDGIKYVIEHLPEYNERACDMSLERHQQLAHVIQNLHYKFDESEYSPYLNERIDSTLQTLSAQYSNYECGDLLIETALHALKDL